MLKRIAYPSPNYSSRGGTAVRLCVVHTAEGSTSIESLGAYFANPNTGASSHTGIDDKVNTVGEYVPPGYKAWTQANANPYCIATELCAFASWSAAEWNAHPQMLANCAAWIAEECARFGIPVRRLSAAEAQGGVAGVCGHNELGAAGGGHWDPGPSFPWDAVLGGAPAPAAPKRKGREMIASTASGDGYWTTTSDGAVYAFGDAQFRGSSHDVDPLTPGAQVVKVTGEVVGIAGRANDGYWLLASDGGIFTFGSAQMYGRPDRV